MDIIHHNSRFRKDQKYKCILLLNNRGKRIKNRMLIAHIPINHIPAKPQSMSNYVGVWKPKTK